jgi:hypothetical protein
MRDDEHLSRLTSVRTEMEAGVIIGGLEARGIPAAMSGVYTSNFRAEAPGWVEVLVADRDLRQAESELREIRKSPEDIDWSQVDVGHSDDPTACEALPWWVSLRFWRRVAVTLTVVYLVWIVVSILGVTAPLLRPL